MDSYHFCHHCYASGYFWDVFQLTEVLYLEDVFFWYSEILKVLNQHLYPVVNNSPALLFQSDFILSIAIPGTDLRNGHYKLICDT